MKTYIIIIFLITHQFLLLAHEDNSNDQEHLPFKEHVDSLCSGHGLIHLDSNQIQAICDQFVDNNDSVLALLESAPSDKYLVQLTGLIIRANYTKSQKEKLLRKSYDRCKMLSDAQVEWIYTIGLLMEETKTLTHEEAKSHSKSKNPYLQSVSKTYLESIRPLQSNEHENQQTLIPKKETGVSKYLRNFVLASIFFVALFLFLHIYKRIMA
jgi:hypothetical protein